MRTGCCEVAERYIPVGIRKLKLSTLMKGNNLEKHSVTRYGSVAQVLHWATAVVVLIAFIYGPGGSEKHVYSVANDFDRQLHETLGLTVLTLAVLRVLWRMVDTRPEAPPAARWMAITAKVVQGALYLLLFALPFTAISGAWLEGHPLTLLAGIKVAPLLGVSHDQGATIAKIHTWLGDAILWLAGLHAVAGLFHYYVLKDDVLASMLPSWLPLPNRKQGT